MRGLDYESLSRALKEIRRTGERGAFKQLAEKAEISLSSLGRIADQKQKSVTLETWRKLHEAEPEKIPPPLIGTLPGEQVKQEALIKYPVLKMIIGRINEALDENYSNMLLLTALRNDIDTALAIEKNGGSGAKKTG